VTTASGTVSLPIADHQTTTSTIQVTDTLELAEVRVGVNLTHTYIGELRVDLVSPAGTPIALHARSGGSNDNIVGTFGLSLATFEPLSRLAGESSAGTWQLRVRDSAGGDTGTLVNWSVETCGRTFEASVPEMRFREIVREADAVRLHWWPYPGLGSYRVYRSTDPTSAGAFVDVTAEDADSGDTQFADASAEPVLFWLVTGVGPQGEGPLGHSGP
jgi:subtilisin-like proprotein convertase family protein